jgi:hypothetical protein
MSRLIANRATIAGIGTTAVLLAAIVSVSVILGGIVAFTASPSGPLSTSQPSLALPPAVAAREPGAKQGPPVALVVPPPSDRVSAGLGAGAPGSGSAIRRPQNTASSTHSDGTVGDRAPDANGSSTTGGSSKPGGNQPTTGSGTGTGTGSGEPDPTTGAGSTPTPVTPKPPEKPPKTPRPVRSVTGVLADTTAALGAGLGATVNATVGGLGTVVKGVVPGLGVALQDVGAGAGTVIKETTGVLAAIVRRLGEG